MNGYEALASYRLAKLKQGFGEQALAAAVSGSVRLPVASRSHEWDGDAAKARIFETFDTAEERRRGFLWVDGDASLKQSYHLGYADVIDGELTIIPRGVSAARGALSGARGADINAPGASERLEQIEAHVRNELGEESMD